MHRRQVSCPFCGIEISTNAKACPNCGSDDNTGWSESTYIDGIDLDDDFDYEEICLNEFPAKNVENRNKYPLWVTFFAGLLLIVFFLFLIR